MPRFQHHNRLTGMFALSVWLGLSSLTARAADLSLPEIIQPIQYRPPTSTVQRREPGSNGLSFGCPSSMEPPVLLMPAGHTGQTIAPRPTFFAFVPAAATVQFLVIAAGGSDAVYSTNFTTQTAGIVRLSLPETAPELQVNQDYWWYVSVLCDPKYARDRSYLQGWIRRVTPAPTLVKQLEQAKVGDRPAIYATAGIWYDTLTTLADLRRTYPQDTRLTKIWTDLLKATGLTRVRELPMIELSDANPASPSPTEGARKPFEGSPYRPPNVQVPGRNTGGGTR